MVCKILTKDIYTKTARLLNKVRNSLYEKSLKSKGAKNWLWWYRLIANFNSNNSGEFCDETKLEPNFLLLFLLEFPKIFSYSYFILNFPLLFPYYFYGMMHSYSHYINV